ncbi:MAG: hypothetical protein V9F01_09605 [Chitinophagaceae bacterium]
MPPVDTLVFIAIMAAGAIFFVLLFRSRKKKKGVAGEDATDVFLRHLDDL